MLLFLFMTITFRCNNRSPITFSQFVFVCLLFYDDLLPNAYLHNFMKENVRVHKTKKTEKTCLVELSECLTSFDPNYAFEENDHD